MRSDKYLISLIPRMMGKQSKIYEIHCVPIFFIMKKLHFDDVISIKFTLSLSNITS